MLFEQLGSVCCDASKIDWSKAEDRLQWYPFHLLIPEDKIGWFVRSSDEDDSIWDDIMGEVSVDLDECVCDIVVGRPDV